MAVNLTTKIKVTFEFPREALKGVDGIEDAFASQYGYTSRIPSTDQTDTTYADGLIDNPETKEQFTVRKIQEYVGEIWKTYNQKKLDATASAQHAALLQATNEAVKSETITSVT